MTRRKTVQIIPPLGYREQVIDHSFISAKGTIKIPDKVETKVQNFLNRKRVSSSGHMNEVIKVQRISIGLLWDDMNWSHCYDYLFTILNGVWSSNPKR